MHGNSPCELIERSTESIGRLPELPEWIISSAIVGMQGRKDVVRHIWDVLKVCAMLNDQNQQLSFIE